MSYLINGGKKYLVKYVPMRLLVLLRVLKHLKELFLAPSFLLTLPVYLLGDFSVGFSLNRSHHGGSRVVDTRLMLKVELAHSIFSLHHISSRQGRRHWKWGPYRVGHWVLWISKLAVSRVRLELLRQRRSRCGAC